MGGTVRSATGATGATGANGANGANGAAGCPFERRGEAPPAVVSALPVVVLVAGVTGWAWSALRGRGASPVQVVAEGCAGPRRTGRHPWVTAPEPSTCRVTCAPPV